MVKLAAENWRQYGSILGSNEIMGLMFRRDVMVLGLSDGVMCGVTGFGLILQKLICWGFISWNNEGWIIQSVSSPQIFGLSKIRATLANGLYRSGKRYILLLSLVGHCSVSGHGHTLFFLCSMVS